MTVDGKLLCLAEEGPERTRRPGVEHSSHLTCFAPAERLEKDAMRPVFETLSRNPVMDGVLRAASGMLAILNEHRQVAAVNGRLLETAGIEDAEALLGARPGEVLGCVHAFEKPNGCGTTPVCASCGVAVAIVASLTEDAPVERLCALKRSVNGVEEECCFSVRSCPVMIESRRFVLLFLQDVTKYREWAAFEEVFIHDFNNMMAGLLGVTELLEICDEGMIRNMAGEARKAALRMNEELAVQQALMSAQLDNLALNTSRLPMAEALSMIREAIESHPAARKKKLDLPATAPDISLETDFVLLRRVLFNMLKNALEATEDGGTVRFEISCEADTVIFAVWNRTPIPAVIVPRIFQRHFTTRSGHSRGLGAYSMKLLGEKVLGGSVTFTTSEDEGTTFCFTLPGVVL
jgi:hypothetical protein